jgi:hypothetical protein
MMDADEYLLFIEGGLVSAGILLTNLCVPDSPCRASSWINSDRVIDFLQKRQVINGVAIKVTSLKRLIVFL